MLYNLVCGLLEQPGLGRLVVYVNDTGSLDPSFYRRIQAVSRCRLVPVPGSANRFIKETFTVPRVVRSDHCASVLYPNYFTPPRRHGARVITVIHDLQYRHYPQYFTSRKRLWLNIAHRTTLRAADQVVVISRFVQEDVLRSYGERFAVKLRVIPNPVSWSRFDESTEPLPTAAQGRPYVLGVASHYPHKNLETLVRAFASAGKRLEDHRLVLAGQFQDHLRGVPAGGKNLRELVRELGLTERVVLPGHVSDGCLGVLYRRASCFVLPSMFEGFGMPAVEALGMGLPVITTRCGALGEVTHGLAVYVDDPLDVGELCDKILSVLERPHAYQPPGEAVRGLRETYEPSRIAQAYLDVMVA